MTKYLCKEAVRTFTDDFVLLHKILDYLQNFLSTAVRSLTSNMKTGNR